jgi:phage terminase large subunit-like protein
VQGKNNIHANKELYKQWIGNKYLKTTTGNVTDYDTLIKDMLKISELCNIVKVYYDRYNATQWAIDCTLEGLPLEPFKQDLWNFNRPTKEFERLMINNREDAEGHIYLDDNPITRYCLRNVALKIGLNDNIKPMRSNEKSKIDGVIAMLQSLSCFFDYGQTGGTVIF